MLRPERWQIGLAGLLLMVAGGMLLLLHPESTQQSALHAAWKQQQILRVARWQSVMPLRPTLNVVDETSLPASNPFSPIDVQRQGTGLLSWTPAGRGGELVLESVWGQVPSVFAQLGEQGMQVSAFTVKAGEARHVLTLQLEGRDEY